MRVRKILREICITAFLHYCNKFIVAKTFKKPTYKDYEHYLRAIIILQTFHSSHEAILNLIRKGMKIFPNEVMIKNFFIYIFST